MPAPLEEDKMKEDDINNIKASQTDATGILYEMNSQTTPTKEHQDEIVYTACYSKWKMYISFLIMMPLYLTLLIGTIVFCINDKEYVKALLLILIFLLPCIVIISDSILFKDLVFYSDKVTKSWYLFGSRTICYQSAKIVGPPKYKEWLSSAYQIRETNEFGKTILKQIPILYISFFFPSKISKTIREIGDFLTEDKENNPRPFKKTNLQRGDLNALKGAAEGREWTHP